MSLYVDADACPVLREAIRVARSHREPVVLVGNDTQNLGRFNGERGVEVLQVPRGQDSADFAMAPLLTPSDIVVTGDTGLAAMALGRGARALTPRGRVFNQVTIGSELDMRHIEQKHRRGGGRTKGPSPFTDEDRGHFERSLERLLTGDGKR